MTESQKIPWKRITVEAAAIVVSILLAFGIDTWWENRRDLLQEQEYLIALRADVVRTIQENERVTKEQSLEHERMLSIAAVIAGNGDLPTGIRTDFPAVVLPAESMDTYRDLVASGGTTLLSSHLVRRTMADLLQRIEYNDKAEAWALNLATSARMIMLGTSPESMSRQQLGEVWTIYLDIGERLLNGKSRLDKAAHDALTAIDEVIDGSP